MKVYGWTSMAPPRLGFEDRQIRCVCLAKSFAEASRAAEAAGLGRLRKDYCCTTGNVQELEIATVRGQVYARGLDDYRGEYRAIGGVVEP